MMPLLPRLATCLVLPLLAAGWLRGAALVSVTTGTLPSLHASPTTVLNVGGTIVAVEAGAAHEFAPEATAWHASAWRPRGRVAATAVDERRGFLVFAAAAAEQAMAVERLERANGLLEARPLPALPAVLHLPRATVDKDVLSVAGTTADGRIALYRLDLTADRPAWRALTPGPVGRGSSLVAQTSALWLTVEGDEATPTVVWRWTNEDGWQQKGLVAGRVVAGAAHATGQAHVLYLLRARSGADLCTYQTITGAWATLANVPAGDVTATTIRHNGILWMQSGAESVGFGYAEIASGKVLLAWLDWVVIVVYLLAMLGMGLYFYLREKRTSTSDFFVGGRSIPFWAAGVSLYTANTSSISYIAIPAKSFETNWQYLTNNLVAILGLMFVAVWIVPLLRRLDLMSVFHYLETRFHPMIRTLASALFMAVQIGSRMSVILFLPSLAIATMTGIDVIWSILIMGVFTMIYTALGGMKAVIWTDFVQLIVKMGGIIFAIVFIVFMLRGGVGELLTIAHAEHKMKLFDWHWDLTKATVWGFIFLVLFDVVLTFPKDQVLMQRVLSTKSDRDAGRSVWTFAAIMLPGGFLFYFTGTALFAFYKTHPERMDPTLTIDATFPLFIAAELPVGVRGLIIAGILAAAMATLSSIMNSVATLASVDFYEKLVKHPNPRVSVRFAEAMTVLTGVLGMGVAILLTRYDIHSLFDVSIELAGLLGGGFAGAYTLGMFTRRANWQGVAIGVVVSITLTTTAWFMKLVHPYFYLGISIFLCIAVGYAASWFFPAPKSLEGLTIFSRKKRQETPSYAT